MTTIVPLGRFLSPDTDRKQADVTVYIANASLSTLGLYSWMLASLFARWAICSAWPRFAKGATAVYSPVKAFLLAGVNSWLAPGYLLCS